ncbi:MAG: hypothetical protein K8R99_01300 [Actinomycetia bacterium]|nr:hypothetical protein [Actinomycetes bacterium]
MAKNSYPIVERHADGVTVIARSNVEAYEVASEALGQDCSITSVDKVQQGGVGGFFATELVKVTAQPARGPKTNRDLPNRDVPNRDLPSRDVPTRTAPNRDSEAAFASAEDLLSSLRTKVPNFADRLLDEWLAETTHEFDRPMMAAPGTVTAAPTASAAPNNYRATTPPPPAEQRPEPATTQPQVAAVPAPLESLASVVDTAPTRVPAPTKPKMAVAPRVSTDQRWSHRALRAAGVPDQVVELAMASEPVTEGEWIVALMRALRGFCGTTLAAPSVMIGSSCVDLAKQLRLVTVAADELVDSVSTVAAPAVGARALIAGLNERQVHLVVGADWQQLGGVQAHVVSASSQADLLEALRVCVAWGGTLGWYWSGDRYERLDEFTVVSHIRELLNRAQPVLVQS